MTQSKKIYYSASLRGENADPALGFQVVSYLRELGHDVLSEHVGSRTREEMERLFFERTGKKLQEMSEPERSRFIRTTDCQWVDEAEFMVVVLTGASLGVGMEIERAVLRVERGLPEMPVWCFVHEAYLSNLSAMVRGIEENHFEIISYQHFEDIQDELTARLK